MHFDKPLQTEMTVERYHQRLLITNYCNIMQQETFKVGADRLERVTKTTARKLFAQGEQVWLYPGGIRLNLFWIGPVTLDANKPFDRQVNSFMIWNSELVKRYGVKYFVLCKK